MKVACPFRNVEIMVSGLDEFTSEEDVRKDFVVEFCGGSGVKVISLRLVRWQERIQNPLLPGRREAVGPVLPDWVDCCHGYLTFVTTQILTGHGVFGNFLHRIGKADSPACEHCDSDFDSAAHTLEECPAWEEERATLIFVVGQDLSLPSVVRQGPGEMASGDEVL
ncbi:uncharacterized protein LOC109860175 [Pseudomyrmex gracilis]|uniref:uncharacterized protein LOC109860175 n=1 Tax=Pseudomyrmex gracilis TaxID=219809 RepID=UPI000994F1DB|nr:uncharacterized protein LOC109860175 [Pseudomyrmex gracilis]